MGNILDFDSWITKNHWSLEHYTLPQKRMSADEWPRDNEESPFDPNYGFKNGRKPREMIATEAEMDSGVLMPPRRDYCAHLFLEMKGCYDQNSPFFWRCRGAIHQYQECQFEDQVLRMKEWERERRLRQRALRKAAKIRQMKEKTDN